MLVLLEKVLEADVRINSPDVVLPRNSKHHPDSAHELGTGLIASKRVLETWLEADEPEGGRSRIDGMAI